MKKINPTDILDGIAASYIEVFGVKDGIALGTELNGEKYHIYDRYCMNPGCKCEEVILHYVGHHEEGNEKVADFGVALSLKNKKYKFLELRGILKKGATEVIEHSLKDSDAAIDSIQKAV
jgi:hypothetical protein